VLLSTITEASRYHNGQTPPTQGRTASSVVT
jgi:hypothetical protein